MRTGTFERTFAYPLWKRWGFLLAACLIWAVRFWQHLDDGRPLSITAMALRGERSDEPIAMTLGVVIELGVTIVLPMWLTFGALRFASVQIASSGLHMSGPFSEKRFVPWDDVASGERTAQFWLSDVFGGGLLLRLRTGEEIPISSGLRDSDEALSKITEALRARGCAVE